MVKVIIKNKDNLLANATVVLSTPFGKVTIKNFQIWKSRIHNSRLGESINIVPTSNGKYKQVFFEDTDKWFVLEKIIFNTFIKSKEDYIDVDEIDKGISEQ